MKLNQNNQELKKDCMCVSIANVHVCNLLLHSLLDPKKLRHAYPSHTRISIFEN